MNTFGSNFRITIFGESHGGSAHGESTGSTGSTERGGVRQPIGGCLGVVIDGVRAGIELSAADFEVDLARRRAGGRNADGELVPKMPGVTARLETDTPEIISGLFEGRTTGAPLTVLFRNENVRSTDYSQFVSHPRPSHADWTASQKFDGYNDPRGGGHFSGRLTLGLVAAGIIAKKMIGKIAVSSMIIETGDVEAALAEKDSVGGIVECRAENVPVGVGEPFFDSIESVVAHLMFAVPGVRGVEFGSGFAAAKMRGSEHNDPIIDGTGRTKTNHAGGIVGGISNGNPIVVRAAVKPTASIAREQQTFNFATGRTEPLEIRGRHDACIATRAAVVLEACLAIALCDLCAAPAAI